MKKLLSFILLLLFVASAYGATIGTRDGGDIDTGTLLEGAAVGMSATEGQTIASGASCLEESCTGSCLFECTWLDAAGADEQECGADDWDSLTGSATYNDGTSSCESGCDSITFTANGNYLEEGTGLNDNEAYLRAQIKPTATTTEFDADFEYQSVIQLRTDQSGYTNLAYVQVYRNLGDQIVFRCRANCLGGTQNCGTTTTEYQFTSGDIYEIEIMSDSATDDEFGWRAWHWNGSSWDQVIGSGGAFDTNSCSGHTYDSDRISIGERYTAGSNPGFDLEIDNVMYSTAAIGQSGRDPS